MKITSIVCLVLASLLVILDHLASYWLGYSETIQALQASMFAIIAEFGLFLIFIILVIVALFSKKHRVWMGAALISFWPLVILTFFLTQFFFGTVPSVVLRGLHDRIMHDYTLDDLRHFASDVNKSGMLKSGWINHGDISNLTPQQKEDFAQLRKKYSFMHWMDDGRILNGPSLLNGGEEGTVDFEWGGALSGHWGCSISTNGSKNEPPPDPLSTTLRLSDDIYLYYD